ncbi:MAG: dephospho-CoA kinase [bacterium]|jgi:dephospho-CoA kinase|nr:dephospho-CoA kinase [bacterium]
MCDRLTPVEIRAPEKLQDGLIQRVIGITGNPGSGKTAVTEFFRRQGATVLNGDELGYAMLERGSVVYPDLISAFGVEILAPNREIDRKKLGERVFASPADLNKLNGIVHPPMREAIHTAITAHRQTGKGMFVLDAALLFEWHIEAWFDLIFVVTAPVAIRQQRLSHRFGGAQTHFEKREAAQLPEQYKLNHADVIIHNDGDLDSLYPCLQTLIEKPT